MDRHRVVDLAHLVGVDNLPSSRHHQVEAASCLVLGAAFLVWEALVLHNAQMLEALASDPDPEVLDLGQEACDPDQEASDPDQEACDLDLEAYDRDQEAFDPDLEEYPVLEVL